MTTYGSFYGRETTLTQGNAFKIYVTDQGLFFARVADRITPEAVGKKPITPLLFGLGGVAANAIITQPALRKLKETEAFYDQLDLSSDEFTRREPKNFRVTAGETYQLELVKAKGLMKSEIAPGTLEFNLNGKTRKFAITSALPAPEIERILRMAMPGISGGLA